MADFPALPLWTDAYMADTMHLTLEEHGAYLKLLMIASRSAECSLPDNDKRIAQMLAISERRWKEKLRPIIAPFWTICEGKWTQKRLLKERKYQEKIRERNARAADARWLKEKGSGYAPASPTHHPIEGTTIVPEQYQNDAPIPIPNKKDKKEPPPLRGSPPRGVSNQRSTPMINQNENPFREGHGFQKIGTLLPSISHLRPTEDTPKAKSQALQTASALTTRLKATPAKAGTPPGGSGSSVTLTSMGPQVLATLSTGKLMQALEASLPPRLKLQPVWRDTELAWETPVRYTVEGTVKDRARAKTSVRNTMRPLSLKEIAKELTTLNTMTKRQKDNRIGIEVLITAYIEKLAPYPGEAVIHVLRKWPETEDGKWWPSWSELYEMLEYRVGERRLMLEALR